MERFSVTVSIEEFKAKAKNANTKKSTCQWLRVHLFRNKEQKIERLEHSRLDEILQQFYAEVKRKDCTDCKPLSFANIQTSLDRRQREAGYIYSLLTSRHFLNSRNVLEGKTRLLRVQGKGKRSNKSCSLSHDEIEQLQQSSRFGYHLRVSLISTLWWFFTLYFGIRDQEHHNMKIEDFTFKKHDGFTYVTFSEEIEDLQWVSIP